MKQSLLVSLIAHIVLLAAIALWPQTSMPKRTGAITIQQIKLAPLPTPEIKPEPSPPKVEPPPPEPKIRPPEQRIARLLKDRLKQRRRTPKPIPTRAPTPVRKKRTPTPVQEKGTPTPTPDRKITFTPFKDVEPTAKTPVPEEEETQEVVFEESFDYQNYIDRLMRTLRRSWDPPAWQPDGPEEIFALVCFTIKSNGMVVNAYIERKSGWDDLDQSALRAVRRSSPVEPLPSEYGRPSVRAHVRFVPIQQ